MAGNKAAVWVRAQRTLAPVVMALLLAACGTLRQESSPASRSTSSIDFISHDADPLHSFNETVFHFNEHLDRFALKPAAEAYAGVVPLPLRRGTTDFFNNLKEPTAILNDLLQGRLRRLAHDTGRFLINSTIGVLGLVDVATPLGLRAHHQDFGITLAKWGVHSGPYLVLPLFGPSDVRDAFGIGADWYSTPTTYLTNSTASWGLVGVETVNTRAVYLNSGNILQQAAGGNEYDFVREAYRQKRQYQLSSGNPNPPPPPIP